MRFTKSLVLCCTLTVLVLAANAQQAANSSTTTIVPQLVNYSGHASDAQGRPIAGVIGISFSIYNAQQGGAPLWIETQNVQADAKGNYTVQLGATTSEGLPLGLFTSGEARWLGVQVNGGEEQSRVLLLSVPYALKAADAQTLGGLPASAFLLAAPSGSGAPASTQPASSAGNGSSPNIGGSGTQDYIPLWTDNNGDLGNSILYQLGTGSSAKIGINLKNPLETLDVNGSELVRGLFEMATQNYATKTKGYNSQPFNLESSAFNSGTGTYTLNHFQWQAEPTGNNTNTTGATLNLLYGTDPASPTETGLKLSSGGIFTFATGQTFPGAGTVTSVGFSAPSSDFNVSGSPVTTTGTLGLTWNVAPTNADTASAIVKRDSNGAFSSGSITSTASTTTGTAIVATGGSNSKQGIGINATGGAYALYASSTNGFGLYASTTGGDGVFGISSSGSGIAGNSTSGAGVSGYGSSASGVVGYTSDDQFYGVAGTDLSGFGTGVYGYGAEGGYFQGSPVTGGSGPAALVAQGAANTQYNGEAGGLFYGGTGDTGNIGGDGIVAFAGNPQPSYAGYFGGNVTVEGNLSKSGGSFKIDHPLDPANKYLYHSFVESPDMMNIYNGNVTTDVHGDAVVELPEWFEALNRDYRYQLTVLGQFAQAIVSQKVADHHFAIKTDKPNVEVSWQVTGIRQDAWANAHRIPVEENKVGRERGYYLHPELFGAPPEQSIAWARHPEALKQMKQRKQPPRRFTTAKNVPGIPTR